MQDQKTGLQKAIRQVGERAPLKLNLKATLSKGEMLTESGLCSERYINRQLWFAMLIFAYSAC
jgi:hypothetical protein